MPEELPDIDVQVVTRDAKGQHQQHTELDQSFVLVLSVCVECTLHLCTHWDFISPEGVIGPYLKSVTGHYLDNAL